MADANNRTCTVYGLASSSDGVVRYIGQTKRNLSHRLSQHIRVANSGNNTHRSSWIRHVIKSGNCVEIIVINDNSTWNLTEIETIRKYLDSGFDLVNATSGGDGVRDPSIQVREKIANASRGRKASEEQKLAMSARMKSFGISKEQREKMLLGVRKAYADRKDEISAKLSAAISGRVLSEETKLKMSSAHLGKKMSNASRIKMSTSGKVRFSSKSEREKTSEATREAMKRPEVLAKIKEASRTFWSNIGSREKHSEVMRECLSSEKTRNLMARNTSKLTESQVHEARELREKGESLKSLCAIFKLSKASMSLMLRGKTYRHVPIL